MTDSNNIILPIKKSMASVQDLLLCNEVASDGKRCNSCQNCDNMNKYIHFFQISISATNSITRRLVRSEYKLFLNRLGLLTEDLTINCPHPGQYTICTQLSSSTSEVPANESIDIYTRRDICSLCPRYRLCSDSGLFDWVLELEITYSESSQKGSHIFNRESCASVFEKKSYFSNARMMMQDPFSEKSEFQQRVSRRRVMAHTLTFDEDKPIRPDAIMEQNLPDTVYSPRLCTQLSEFDIGLLMLIISVKPIEVSLGDTNKYSKNDPRVVLIEAVSKLVSDSQPLKEIMKDMITVSADEKWRYPPTGSVSEWDFHSTGRDWWQSLFIQLKSDEKKLMENLMNNIVKILDESWPMIQYDTMLSSAHHYSSTRPLNVGVGNMVQGAAWRLLELFPSAIAEMLKVMRLCNPGEMKDWGAKDELIQKIVKSVKTRRAEHQNNVPVELDDLFTDKWKSELFVMPVKSVVTRPAIDIKLPWHPLIIPIEIKVLPENAPILFYSHIQFRGDKQ